MLIFSFLCNYFIAPLKARYLELVRNGDQREAFRRVLAKARK